MLPRTNKSSLSLVSFISVITNDDSSLIKLLLPSVFWKVLVDNSKLVVWKIQASCLMHANTG